MNGYTCLQTGITKTYWGSRGTPLTLFPSSAFGRLSVSSCHYASTRFVHPTKRHCLVTTPKITKTQNQAFVSREFPSFLAGRLKWKMPTFRQSNYQSRGATNCSPSTHSACVLQTLALLPLPPRSHLPGMFFSDCVVYAWLPQIRNLASRAAASAARRACCAVPLQSVQAQW